MEDAVVSVKSRMQKIVSLLVTEAEIIAMVMYAGNVVSYESVRVHGTTSN